jgi:3-hydroxyisobutyrate dehydrogenase
MPARDGGYHRRRVTVGKGSAPEGGGRDGKGDEMSNGHTIGVLGLGYMGSRMASKLLDAGHTVTVWNRQDGASHELEQRGATVAQTPEELAGRVELVLASLAHDEAVLEVALGEAGAMRGIRAGSVYVECSTVSPETIARLAEAAGKRGAKLVDASVSGSTPTVEQGTAIVLAGGDADAVDLARPALEPWSKAVIHMGGTGAGTATKLAVNVILGVGMQAIAEAIVLGEAQGIRRETLIDALGQTAVIADAYRAKLENAKRQEYPVAFAARLMRKDFGLALDRARAHGIELPATSAAAKAADEEARRERGDTDFSAVIRGMEEMAGLAPAR